MKQLCQLRVGVFVRAAPARALADQPALALLQFGVYVPPQQTSRLEIYPVGKASLSRFVPLWDQADYATAYQVVRGYIAAGDIYQANLTFPLQAVTATPSAVLCNALS